MRLASKTSTVYVSLIFAIYQVSCHWSYCWTFWCSVRAVGSLS